MATTITHNITSRAHDLLPPALLSSPTFGPLLRFLEDIDKRLDVPHHRDRRAFSPRFDLLELPAQFELYGDLPGVNKADLVVELQDQEKVLVVKGKRGECCVTGKGGEGAQGTYIIRERGMGAFEKRFRLPGEVNRAGIRATLEEGVLRVVVPRVMGAQEDGAHRIEIL